MSQKPGPRLRATGRLSYAMMESGSGPIRARDCIAIQARIPSARPTLRTVISKTRRGTTRPANSTHPSPVGVGAAYTPEKSAVLPPDFALAAVGIANGFGLIDVESGMTVYAAPASRKLSSDWQAVRAPAVARPVGDFAIAVSKEDGSRQWTYKGEALYTFAGDYAAGDVNGLSSTDKGIQAALVYRNFIPSGLQINQYTGRGPLMTTRNGSTLYTVARYELLYGGRETRNGYHISYNDAKSQGTLGCRGDCTKTWKPVVASAHAQGWGLWEVVARPDGSKQWAFKGQPLYTYIGDKEPGDIRGNNRNVVVFGGAKGELVYADGGGDPHDPARVGDIAMTFAQGAVLRNPGPRGNGGAGLYWHTVGLVF